MNCTLLGGRLGADPDLRYTQSGSPVLNIRLCTSEKYKSRDSDEWKEIATWHNITVWGKRAEGLSKFLHKGDTIFVRGRIRNSSYEDKDGVKRYKSEIIADEIDLTGSKRSGGGPSPEQERSIGSEAEPLGDFGQEDIPF